MSAYQKSFSLLLIFSGFSLARGRDLFLFEQKKYFVEEIDGLAEQSARLPCNMTIAENDYVFLVLWFKEGLTTPIYSYDVREMLSGEPKHWWDSDVLEDRAFFNAHSNPPHLFIRRLVIADSGLYKCRVDFQKEATRNSRVNLTVIVPPHQVILVDQVKGGEITGRIGPYKEGSSLRLSCISHGGFPHPSVKWLIENDVIDEVVDKLDEDVIRNDLVLENIKRSYSECRLTCSVTNNKRYPPMSSSATIDMILPPLDVRIHSFEEPLSTGRMHKFFCSSSGSRPPPSFSWYLEDHALPTAPTNSSSVNETTSILSIKILASFNEQTLSCKVNNDLIADVVLQYSSNLTVYYIPLVSAKFGKNLDSTNIKEHDDAYFECNITSNPTVYKISWRHNGVEIAHDLKKGVIISNQTLVLQNVNRFHSGEYTCHASNVEGDGVSPPVFFNVKYAPVCQDRQETEYGVSKMENARIPCEVDAEPMVTSFKWYFNNTAESLSVPEGRYTIDPSGRSVVTYTPMSEMDYGTLLCYAKNSVGWQNEPCLFHIIPTTVPEAATNCSLFNLATNSFSVRCFPGIDGGLKRLFVLEVYSTAPHKLHTNITSDTCRFDVDGLESDSEFQLIVYSANSKGRSGITRLVGITQKLPIKQLETRLEDGNNGNAALENALHLELAAVVGIAAGSVGAFIILFAVILILLKRPSCLCAKGPTTEIDSLSMCQKAENPNKGGGFFSKETIQGYRSDFPELENQQQLSCLQTRARHDAVDYLEDVDTHLFSSKISGGVALFDPLAFARSTTTEVPHVFESSCVCKSPVFTAQEDIAIASVSPRLVEFQHLSLRCDDSCRMLRKNCQGCHQRED